MNQKLGIIDLQPIFLLLVTATIFRRYFYHYFYCQFLKVICLLITTKFSPNFYSLNKYSFINYCFIKEHKKNSIIYSNLLLLFLIKLQISD